MPKQKSWTWVGAFGPGLMLCATSVRVGLARAAWWAVWDGERLHERTYRRRGPVVATPERVHVPGVLDLTVEPGAPWAVRNGRDLDAQAARAHPRHGARPPGRPARRGRRVRRPPPAPDVVVVVHRRRRAGRRAPR